MFHVSNYLLEQSQKTDNSGSPMLYSDAITKVPKEDQNRTLSIAGLSDKSKELVNDMAKKMITPATKAVRKYARAVATIMWKSDEFRSRLAAYWDSQEMFRDLEIKRLDEVAYTDSKDVEKEQSRKNRIKHLKEQMEFCKRRKSDCGAGDAYNERDEDDDKSGSSAELQNGELKVEEN